MCRLPAAGCAVRAAASLPGWYGGFPNQLRLRSSGAARRAHGACRWLQTLCALRLRERKPNAVTSDALCRKTVPVLGSLHPTRGGARPTGVGTAPSVMPGPRRSAHPVRAAKLFGPERLPSARCTALLPRRAPARQRIWLAHSRSTPLSSETSRAPLSRGATDPYYPARRQSPLRVMAATLERRLSPTSATDLQHEHRSNRSIPAPASVSRHPRRRWRLG